MINEILTQRKQTHGSFNSNAKISQLLKDDIKQGDNYHELTYEQKESLDMILHKIARIVNGNPNEKDHWVDIIGYATLIKDSLNEKIPF